MVANHGTKNTVIQTLFAGSTEISYMKLLIRSGANIKIPIIRMILLTVMNLSGTVKILVMVTVIYGIKKNSLPSTKVLGFLVCRVTSKIL